MSWMAIIAAVIFPNLGGLVGSIFTAKNIPIWYNETCSALGKTDAEAMVETSCHNEQNLQEEGSAL